MVKKIISIGQLTTLMLKNSKGVINVELVN